MAKTRAAPTQDSAITPEADIVTEVQQTEQADFPPMDMDAPIPEMTAEEAVILEQEGKAALFEMGELFPDSGGLTNILPDISDDLPLSEPISFEAAKAALEAETVITPDIPKQKITEDARQKQEKPLAETESEQPSKRKSRTPKTEKAADEAPDEKPKKPPKQEKTPKTKTTDKVPPSKAQSKPEAPVVEPAQEPASLPPEPQIAPRADEQEQIVFLNLSELHAFKNHPFQVKTDDEMRAMVESVKDKGVTQPAIVRPREDGGYEIVSGHRRQKASELAGFSNMPCIVRKLTDEQAITQMVEDNTNQRESILPSERAKALKMQLDAIKRQGARSDIATPSQVGSKLETGQRSNQVVADRNKMTVKQVQRYIKLNDLSPELLKMVDEKRIGFTPAVELSYVKPKNQRYIAVAIEGQQSAPSLSQAQRMRELDQKNLLNGDVIDGIMLEEKKEVDKVILSSQELGQYFGKEQTPREMKDQILKLLDEWKGQQKDLVKPEKSAEQEK